MHMKLGEGTAGPADPNWPKGYSDTGQGVVGNCVGHHLFCTVYYYCYCYYDCYYCCYYSILFCSIKLSLSKPLGYAVFPSSLPSPAARERLRVFRACRVKPRQCLPTLGWASPAASARPLVPAALNQSSQSQWLLSGTHRRCKSRGAN